MQQRQLLTYVLVATFVFSFLHYCHASEHETVSGKGCYKYGDNDTPRAARETALNMAKRNAIENYKVFINSKSKTQDFVLKQDIIESLSTGYLHNLRIIKEQEQGREICIWLEAKVIPDEVDRLIEKLVSERDTANNQSLIPPTPGATITLPEPAKVE